MRATAGSGGLGGEDGVVDGALGQPRPDDDGADRVLAGGAQLLLGGDGGGQRGGVEFDDLLGAPATTSVISPFTPPAAQSASSASGPRRISSRSWSAPGRPRPGERPRRRRPRRRARRRAGAAIRRTPSSAARRPAPRGARAAPRLARQEALEAEPVDRQPGDRQRRRHRGRPRHRGDGHAGVDRGPHQPVAGIGDRRHSGVGEQQHRSPPGQRGRPARAAAPSPPTRGR